MESNTEITDNKHRIYERMQKIGTAISFVNANNTHSGNLSMRDPLDPDLFYITASGSQGGHLIEQDIVPIHFSGVSWGDARGSTESTIHREILKIPRVNKEIIFCSMSAVPENFEFPLYRTSISFQEDDSLDLRLDKLIYQNTHQNSCMITSSPLATAEGMAILAEEYGMEVLLDSKTKIP